jgi:outer membrane protein OmpA-like peptidoglycan-associated protein
MSKSFIRCVRPACLLLSMVALNLHAAPQLHCPPLGMLPNFQPREAGADLHDYDRATFMVTNANGESAELPVAGHYCYQTYSAKEGAPTMSDLEIHENYKHQLAQLGAQITSDGGRDTYAKLSKNGGESWMRIYSSETTIEITVVEKAGHKQVLTAPSGQDYRLLGHMPTFDVSGEVRQRNFDEYTFVVRQGDEDKELKVQGKLYEVHYGRRDGAPPVSGLDVQENYRAALQNLGAEITSSGSSDLYARVLDKGVPVWLRVYTTESSVEVYAVEEKPFQASIQPPPAADALKTALDSAGHVALYINFDFAKATLKADAKPVVDQVLALLKANPALKLAIEGHTDNVGGGEANQKLSEQRAQAVVAALVQGGIAADRLSAAGFGAGKPVADNTSSEGRAKNRRVELVKH